MSYLKARGAVCSAEVAAGALINWHHGMDNAHKMTLAGRVGSALPDIDSLAPPLPPSPGGPANTAKSSTDIEMDPHANITPGRF